MEILKNTAESIAKHSWRSSIESTPKGEPDDRYHHELPLSVHRWKWPVRIDRKGLCHAANAPGIPGARGG